MFTPDLLVSLEFAECRVLKLPVSTQSQKWATWFWKPRNYMDGLFQDMLVSGQKQRTMYSAAFTYCWLATWQMASGVLHLLLQLDLVHSLSQKVAEWNGAKRSVKDFLSFKELTSCLRSLSTPMLH